MDKEQDTAYLFEMSKILKLFYETPVIFVTKKEYSDNVFNTMCIMRSAMRNSSKDEMIEIIVEFHLQWLHAINELENFKKLITSDLARDEIYQTISYTIDALTHRLKSFQRYIEKYSSSLSNAEQANLYSDLEIIEDMHKDVTHTLLEKLRCYRNFTSNYTFELQVKEDLESLMQWLDKIYDELALNLCKFMTVNVPHLSTNLTETLQQIVDEIQNSSTDSAQEIIEQLKVKGKELISLIRGTSVHDLEISKVVEKIAVLEDRIQRLESEPFSAALMALQHKKNYLEGRLASLENLKLTLISFHQLTDVKMEDMAEEDICVCKDFYQLRIFNHLLPMEERERLVTELCYLWDLAVFGERSRKSMISILSAADMKEEYTDDLGSFYYDEHSRKIYKIPGDDRLYQPNEMNKLVPVADDADHVYFYDECGRYFMDCKTKQRVYKAHDTASEYMMGSTGTLLKLKEVRDGITYYYDNYGRYYINDEGKHIYNAPDSTSEYENDGLGNLVRVRSRLDLFQPCPDDAHVTEDFRYLKQAVGPALRECITNCILHQPKDPIKYLSTCLIKYRENLEIKEKRATEKEELNIEREIRFAEERAAAERAAMEAALLAQGGSEASYDSNLVGYTSMHPQDDDATSAD